MNIKLISIAIATATASLTANAMSFVSVINGTVGSEANPPQNIVIGEIDGGTPPQPDPSVTPRFKAISGEGMSAYAIDENGDVWAIGDNQMGNFGDGTTSNSSVWKKVKTGSFIDVSSQGGTTFIVNSNGDVYGTGANWNGQLGDGSFDDTQTFKLIKSGSFVDVELSALTHLALDSSGNMWVADNASWHQVASNVKDISAYENNQHYYINNSGDLFKIDGIKTNWVSTGETGFTEISGHYGLKNDGVYVIESDGSASLIESGSFKNLAMAGESARVIDSDGNVQFCYSSCSIEKSGSFANVGQFSMTDTFSILDDGTDLIVKGSIFGSNSYHVNTAE